MIPNLFLQDSKRTSVPFLSWVGLGVGRAAKRGGSGSLSVFSMVLGSRAALLA